MRTQQEEFLRNLEHLQSEIVREAKQNLLGRSGNKFSEQEKNNIEDLKGAEVSLENFPMFGAGKQDPSFISNLNAICSNGLLEDFVSQFSTALSAQSNRVFSLREKNLQREAVPGLLNFGAAGIAARQLHNQKSGIKYELVLENSEGAEDGKKLFWLGIVQVNQFNSNYDAITQLFTVQAGKFVAEKTSEGKITVSTPATSPQTSIRSNNTNKSPETVPLLGGGDSTQL